MPAVPSQRGVRCSSAESFARSKMNDGEQRHRTGGSVGTDDFRDPAAALTELRAQLEAGRIAHGLNQTQLARRAGLGRTSVSQALSSTASAHTAQTVGALARALRLDVRPLPALPAAVSGAPRSSGNALGKPIADCDPYDLEVHPAAGVPTRSGYGSRPGGAIGRGRQAPLLAGEVPRLHWGAVAGGEDEVRCRPEIRGRQGRREPWTPARGRSRSGLRRGSHNN
ncbi:helix-turn-helix domain-containing protein [Streptomyces griseoluteus]|uniref:helix-turn-helix domain-containing protein n=1 Tax=Streptomyces griseoluteus TaxID=29306 RepID=UPI0036FD8CF8